MAATSITPAWGGVRPADEHDARERVLDAATRCIERYGLKQASLRLIATEAGVTKPTLYRYFSGRDEIISQTLLRSAEGYVERVRSALASVTDPSDYIVEGLIYAVHQLPKEPLLRRVGEVVQSDAFILRTGAGASAIAVGRECLRPIEKMVPALTESDLDEIAEMAVRLSLSLILSPEPRRTRVQLRAFLHRRIVPMLGLPAQPTHNPGKRPGEKTP